MCRHLGMNTREVIDAAATKPFGFMPFYPGPGIGGHCIPVDPNYLAWKMRLNGYEARFIHLAQEINRSMPNFVIELVDEALNERRRCLNGARILALGVAYKRGERQDPGARRGLQAWSRRYPGVAGSRNPREAPGARCGGVLRRSLRSRSRRWRDRAESCGAQRSASCSS